MQYFFGSSYINIVKSLISYVESLLQQIRIDGDSIAVDNLYKLASNYSLSNIGSALFYSKKGLSNSPTK